MSSPLVSRAELCVTEGAVEELPGTRLSVGTAKMRAYLNRSTQQSIAARVTYVGPTATDVPLASGELRRQFGFKLRALDACNLVYVMWRIEPAPQLVVSVKTNPGQSASSECGNRGYRNLKPQHAAAIVDLRPGATHTLRAQMNADDLRVFIDEAVVWQGSLGRDAAGLQGPVGIRSDNMRLVMELRAGEGRGTASQAATCHSEADAAE